MPDSSAQETTPQKIQRIQARRNEQGKEMTPQQRRVADSIRRIRERMAAKEPISIKEQSALTLYETTEKHQGDIDIERLSLQEKMALLNSIGYSVGEQLVGTMIHATRAVRQATQEAIPLTLPITGLGIGSAHNFALRNPELASYIAAADDAAILAAGLAYLGYKSIREKREGASFITPIRNEMLRLLDTFKDKTGRRITQTVLFSAGLTGAMVALDDPNGAGTTVAPILGGIASLEFTHKLTEKLLADVIDEVAKREAQGQTYDITDPTFLLSTGITSFKDMTRNITEKIKNFSLSNLLKRIGTKEPDDTILPRGAMEKLAEVLFIDEVNGKEQRRGGTTPRHQAQPPKGH